MAEPSATDAFHEARKASRTTLWVVCIGIPLLAVLTIAFGMVAARGTAASKDNLNATSVQLANNNRNDCITKRRNAQLAAIGEEVDAGQKALKYGLLLSDTELLKEQADRFDAASKALEAATKSLDPKVLNTPAPVGCGPPILTIADLKEAQK